MCVQDLFSLALAHSSFRLGNKAGKSWAGPLTSEPHFTSFGSAAGGSSVPLWGEEPRGFVRALEKSGLGRSKGPHIMLGIVGH